MRALEATMGGAAHRHGSGSRRAGALLLAAALTLGGAAAAFAGSSPGSPLYEARIWLETATLPADADARALERIRHIEERLVDSERAAVAEDGNAVAAATEAYREAVDVAVAEAGTDTAKQDRLRAALGLHVTVLETLADRLPAAAANGIARAIEASQKAVNKIDEKHSKPAATDGSAEPTDKPGNGPPASGDLPDHTPRGNDPTATP